MKLGPVTTLDNRNKATSKKCGDNVISKNYDVRNMLTSAKLREPWY